MEGKRLQDLATATGVAPASEHIIAVSHVQSVPITIKTGAVWHSRHDDPVDGQPEGEKYYPRRKAPEGDAGAMFSSQFLRLASYPENLVAAMRSDKRLKRLRQNVLVQLVIGVVLAAGFGGFLPTTRFASSLQYALALEAKSGYAQMELAKKDAKEQKFDHALQHFQTADGIFNHALATLQSSGQASTVLPYLLDDSSYRTAQALLQIASLSSHAGMAGARLGALFITGLATEKPGANENDPFAKVNGVLSGILEASPQMTDLSGQVETDLTESMRLLQNYAASPVANADLEQVRTAAWNSIPGLAEAAKVTHQTMANLGSLLGVDRNRRYMLLFLNNTELRPGGGFLGSFATFMVKKGQVEGFTVQTNIYKLDDAFNKVAHVDAPYPVSELNKNWTLHDANWDTDFHASAEKVAWFYKQEGGEDVDGVFSIDTTFLEQLLAKTGPITVPSQNMTLTAENAVSMLQYKSEKEYLANPEISALNQPKKAIADAFPFLLSQAFNLTKSNPSSILDVFDTSIREKHVMFAPFFAEAKPVAANTHLDSTIPVNDDFLMVNNGNLGGVKSSLHIVEHVDLTIKPTDHSTLLHTVTIRRTHTGAYVWPDGDNHNYVRVVVPKDAVYLQSSSTGSENGVVEDQAYVEQFDQYQTFGHWLTTPVGATKSAVFEYETPIETSLLKPAELRLHYLKQPGWTEDDLTVHFVNNANTTFNLSQHDYHLAAREDLRWQIPLSRSGPTGTSRHP